MKDSRSLPYGNGLLLELSSEGGWSVRNGNDGRVMSIKVDNTYNDKGSPATAIGDRGFVINVHWVKQGFRIQTDKGPQLAPLFVVMAHELGHAVFGYRDPDPQNTADVLRNRRGRPLTKLRIRFELKQICGQGLPIMSTGTMLLERYSNCEQPERSSERRKWRCHNCPALHRGDVRIVRAESGLRSNRGRASEIRL